MKITSIDMIENGDVVFMKRRNEIIVEGYVFNVGLRGGFSVFWEDDPQYLYSYKVNTNVSNMELVKKGPNFEKEKLQAIIRLS